MAASSQPDTDKPSPDATPRPPEVEALLQQLPEAYEAWEASAADPSLLRIQKRISELLAAEAKSPPKSPAE